MSGDLIALGVTWFVVFLFSTTLHEAGHAYAAQRLGDPTAYLGGQVSLNPLPHIQRAPIGMVAIPIATFLLSRGTWMMGWARAPYDPVWAHNHPRRAALMAFAGPAANLLLVVAAGLAIRYGVATGAFHAPDQISFTAVTAANAAGAGGIGGHSLAAALVTPLSIFFSLNVILFVFNLLPLPPLDGSAVITILMSDDFARRYQEFIRQPIFSLLGIYVAWQIFDPILRPVSSLAWQLLYPGVLYR